MVAKVRALYYAYKLVARVSYPGKKIHKTFNRETTLQKNVSL